MIEDVRDWFQRAIATYSGFGCGVVLAWWLMFEQQHGTEVRHLLLVSSSKSDFPAGVKCVATEPQHKKSSFILLCGAPYD
jgi:hypothetical protein